MTSPPFVYVVYDKASVLQYDANEHYERRILWTIEHMLRPFEQDILKDNENANFHCPKVSQRDKIYTLQIGSNAISVCQSGWLLGGKLNGAAYILMVNEIAISMLRRENHLRRIYSLERLARVHAVLQSQWRGVYQSLRLNFN